MKHNSLIVLSLSLAGLSLVACHPDELSSQSAIRAGSVSTETLPSKSTNAQSRAGGPKAAGARPGAPPDDESTTEVERGAHIVLTSGCHDCHTPFKMGAGGPEPDMTRMLSGHPESMKLPPAPAPSGPWIVSVAATNTAWAGPWGTSYTANLTPDDETGLGRWSFENFKDTIRTGRHLGRGRPVLPPMPIPMYKHFTDDELRAIYAYLRTIPAVKNSVPDPLPPAAGTPS